jgi:hypothetical protein
MGQFTSTITKTEAIPVPEFRLLSSQKKKKKNQSTRFELR